VLRHGLIPGAAIAAFGLFFLSLPSAVLALLMRARREERLREERRRAAPSRPWTWRDDFANGILRPESDPATGFAAGFSVFGPAGLQPVDGRGFGSFSKLMTGGS